MSKYIFSLILFCFSAKGICQKNDSIKEKYGFRVGIDLHRLSKSFYDKDYEGLEFVGDYRISHKFYVAGEFGNENKTIDDDRFNFTTKGSYFKVGFDFNSYENWLDMKNMIFIGMRYGVSAFEHTLNTYKIYEPTNYYGVNTITSGEQFKGLNAQWIEVVGGVKAEVFTNLYVGFSLRLNYLVSNKKPVTFDNLFIPGFNKTYDGKFGTGFSYNLSYMVPIYKKNKKTQPLDSKFK